MPDSWHVSCHLLVLQCVPCRLLSTDVRMDWKYLVCRVGWAALQQKPLLASIALFRSENLLSSSAWHALIWVQAHARELAALHKQLQGLPCHLPGFQAQLDQALAGSQAYKAQAATVLRLQEEWQRVRLDLELMEQKIPAMGDSERLRPDWQLPLMRRRAVEKRLRGQLQSVKQELEALAQPAAAAAQLRSDLEAAIAQRRKMQVGHGGWDVARRPTHGSDCLLLAGGKAHALNALCMAAASGATGQQTRVACPALQEQIEGLQAEVQRALSDQQAAAAASNEAAKASLTRQQEQVQQASHTLGPCKLKHFLQLLGAQAGVVLAAQDVCAGSTRWGTNFACCLINCGILLAMFWALDLFPPSPKAALPSGGLHEAMSALLLASNGRLRTCCLCSEVLARWPQCGQHFQWSEWSAPGSEPSVRI